MGASSATNTALRVDVGKSGIDGSRWLYGVQRQSARSKVYSCRSQAHRYVENFKQMNVRTESSPGEAIEGQKKLVLARIR